MADDELPPTEEPAPEDAPMAEALEAAPEASAEGPAEDASDERHKEITTASSQEGVPESAPPEGGGAPEDETPLSPDQEQQQAPADTGESPQYEETAQEPDSVDILIREDGSLKDEGLSQDGEDNVIEKRVYLKSETIEDDLFEQMSKSKSVLDVLKDSTLDIETKKEILEKKKQKVLGSIISIRRGDPTFFDRQKVPKFQNSYKLDSDKPFNHEKVENILRDVMIDALHDLSYDPDKCSKQAKWASSAIRAKVKEQEYDRYKIICYVSIGEKLCQDVLTILRFLWDTDRDRYAIYVHENLTLFGIALCFGIYYE